MLRPLTLKIAGFVLNAITLHTALLAGFAGFTACHRDPPPVAPGEPIPPAAEVTLGTMDNECDGLLLALASYKTCHNLDDDDRYDIDAWSQRAQQDFAAGKKAKPEPNAEHAIAAACHKAATSVHAATERCNAGKRPPR